KPFRKGVALMSASGTGVRILTPRGIQGQPSFSPDGGSIVYQRDIAAGNDSVWIMRTDGTHKLRVTRSPFRDTDPNFPPNGKRLTRRTGRTYDALPGSAWPAGWQVVGRRDPGDEASPARVAREGRRLRWLTPPGAARRATSSWCPAPAP